MPTSSGRANALSKSSREDQIQSLRQVWGALHYMSGERKMSNRLKQRVYKLKNMCFVPLSLAPALIVIIGFTYIPAGYSLVLSLFKTKLFSAEYFVGLEQFTSVLNDRSFWTGFRNTCLYSLFSIAGTIVVGLLIAVLMNTKMKGKTIFRTVFFMPYVIPYAAYTLLWYWLFDPRYGLINLLLGYIGINPIPWLTAREWVLPAFILMDIWKRAGFAMVLFLSGLQSISSELYDAGMVDGANSWQKFRHITLPLLSPVTMFVVIISFMHTFQLFVEPFVMTKGGPGEASTSVVYIIYQEGFRLLNIGRSSAMAVILFAVVFAITLLILAKFDVKGVSD